MTHGFHQRKRRGQTVASYRDSAVSHRLVDGQSNGDSSLLVRVQDPGLRTHHLRRSTEVTLRTRRVVSNRGARYKQPTNISSLHRHYKSALEDIVSKKSYNLLYVSLYKPTILCFPASLIHRMLSLYCCLMPSVTLALICSNTPVAMWSVTARSWGSPDVQTQRNGPKPREKMSLGGRK